MLGDRRVVEDEVLVGHHAVVGVDEEGDDVDLRAVADGVRPPGDVQRPGALVGQVDDLAADEGRHAGARGVAAMTTDVGREPGVGGGVGSGHRGGRGEHDPQRRGAGVHREPGLADPGEPAVGLTTGHDHHVGDGGREVDGGETAQPDDPGAHLDRLRGAPPTTSTRWPCSGPRGAVAARRRTGAAGGGVESTRSPGRTSSSSRRNVASSITGMPSARARTALRVRYSGWFVTRTLVRLLTDRVTSSPAATSRSTMCSRDSLTAPVTATRIPCASGRPVRACRGCATGRRRGRPGRGDDFRLAVAPDERERQVELRASSRLWVRIRANTVTSSSASCACFCGTPQYAASVASLWSATASPSRRLRASVHSRRSTGSFNPARSTSAARNRWSNAALWATGSARPASRAAPARSGRTAAPRPTARA